MAATVAILSPQASLSRRMLFETLPPVLSLQLKRFVSRGATVGKLSHHVAFSPQLLIDASKC